MHYYGAECMIFIHYRFHSWSIFANGYGIVIPSNRNKIIISSPLQPIEQPQMILSYYPT